MTGIIRKCDQYFFKPMTVEPSSSPKFKYLGRSLRVANSKDFPEVKAVFKGATQSIDDIFFPKTPNSQTSLMKELIVDLIMDTESVQFQFGTGALDVQMKHKGVTYSFYDLMKKVKWDLISLDDAVLNKHIANTRDYKYSFSYCTVPYAPPEKEYLYKELHDAEKCAISRYGSLGSTFNDLLRGTTKSYDRDQKHFVTYLCLTAVLCSGLNKIPPSKEFDGANAYAFRCMKDARGPRGSSIIKTCTKKMKAYEKIKELGFTGVAYKKPQPAFLGSGYYGNAEDCLKIYENPRALAKDISGLSGFPYECECLFLPNTKEQILREIIYSPESSYHDATPDRHIYMTKLVSKRQKVT
ncbi:MAG: hypothetical protein S4CHLAM6_13390 [Chlamydiae bacterium]|nr:hypothetical protein [Chlamydiota bacterium]